jgi:hypothetical protein
VPGCDESLPGRAMRGSYRGRRHQWRSMGRGGRICWICRIIELKGSFFRLAHADNSGNDGDSVYVVYKGYKSPPCNWNLVSEEEKRRDEEAKKLG